MDNKYLSVGQVISLPQELIIPNPAQPRKHFDYDELNNLASSIKENGILQPILVRSIDKGKFELVSGERRLRAARLCGYKKVPVLIIDLSDEKSAVFALIENVQRENLNFFEEAAAIYSLKNDFGLTNDELSKKLGKSTSAISNKQRLLFIPDFLREIIISNHLTERHARALLKINDFDNMYNIIETVIKYNYNVSQTEKLVDELLKPTVKKPRLRMLTDVRLFINTFNHAIETMKNAGIDAFASKEENEEFIEYTVKISKKTAYIKTG